MFRRACQQNRNSIYGVLGLSQMGVNQVNYCTGTAFMIASEIVVTAAHGIHQNSNHSQPVHGLLQVVRTPDIGQPFLQAILIAEDISRDIALLRIINPSSADCLTLIQTRAEIGRPVGSLGFPLATVTINSTGYTYNLVERFQGAYISAFQQNRNPTITQNMDFYETDALMYGGSSGCPGFLETGEVFGLHVASMNDSQGQNANSSRAAIALWVPSNDIISFAQQNGIII